MSMASNELIEAVHVVEDKYGSLSKAPENCQELQVCHQIVNDMPHRRSEREMDEIKREIQNLFTAGYARYDIATMVGTSYAMVSRIIRNSNLLPIQKVFEFYADGHLVTVGTYLEIAKVYHDMNPKTLRKLPYKHPDQYRLVKVGERRGFVN